MKKIEVINSLTLLAQITLLIFVLAFGIAGMFYWELFTICRILAGLLMFILAFNNHTVFKRKHMTVIYIVIGIFILASVLFG